MADEPVQNPIEAQPAKQQAAAEGAQTPPNALSPETHIPVGVKDQCSPEKSNGEVREWWKVVVETLTLLAVIWYACIASNQLTEMHNATIATRDAAIAAKNAAITADNTFKLTFRPRIEILVIGQWREEINGKINNHLDGGFLRVQLTYTNRGPFSARNVRIFTYDRVGPTAIQGSYEEQPQQFPQIFPMGDATSNTYFVGKTRYDAEALKGLIRGALCATFSVLIVYDDDLGKETHHAEYCDVFRVNGYNDICPWPVKND